MIPFTEEIKREYATAPCFYCGSQFTTNDFIVSINADEDHNHDESISAYFEKEGWRFDGEKTTCRRCRKVVAKYRENEK